MADAIQAVRGDDIQKYIDSIRRNVCGICAGSRRDGSCELRQEVRCALDAYLLLVVEAVQEAGAKVVRKKGVGTATARFTGHCAYRLDG